MLVKPCLPFIAPLWEKHLLDYYIYCPDPVCSATRGWVTLHMVARNQSESHFGQSKSHVARFWHCACICKQRTALVESAVDIPPTTEAATVTPTPTSVAV